MGRIRRTVFAASVLAIGYAACPADKDTWDGCVDRTFDAVEGWLEDDSDPQWPGGPAGEQVASAETPTPGAQSPEPERSTPAPVQRVRVEQRRATGGALAADLAAIEERGTDRRARRRGLRHGDAETEMADQDALGAMTRISEQIPDKMASGDIAWFSSVNNRIQGQLQTNPGRELRGLARELYDAQNTMLELHFGLPHPIKRTGACIEALQEDAQLAAQVKAIVDNQLIYTQLLNKAVQRDKWNAILKGVYGTI